MKHEPAPGDEEAPTAIELALTLLRLIADDAGLRGSHRVAARKHFCRLARLVAEERKGVDN